MKPALLSTVNLDNAVATACAHLRGGALVALPTETVYGLAADCANDAAVAQIFAMKGRPSFNPLIVHVADRAMAQRYGIWNDLAEQLSAAFWPGPLTMVLPRRADAQLSLLTCAGGDTVALRMPSHPVMQAVLQGFGAGLAAPSANRSGRVSPTMAAHVMAAFAEDDVLVLDGGACRIGLESTVVDASGDAAIILRPGSITEEMLAHAGVALSVLQDKEGAPLLSPGLLSSHYAPRIPLRLDATDAVAGEALMSFGPHTITGAAAEINLSESSDLIEAASRLFAAMHQLDNPAYRAIAVMPIPQHGIGIAINDRLNRAAAGRV